MTTNNDKETKPEPEVTPEHIESVITPKEFETKHQWRQYGDFVRCESCPFAHASYIGNNKLMCGVDSDGKPVFKTIEIWDSR